MSRHTFVVVAATAGMAVAAALLYAQSSGRTEQQAASSAGHLPAESTTELPLAAISPAVQLTDSWDHEFVAFVERKYRYLFADVRLSDADRQRLTHLLLEREAVVSAMNPVRTADEIEGELRALLAANEYAQYESLRESGTEQHHLVEYAGGISNLAPLSAAQERAVLETRLRHKKNYEAILRDSGLERASLSLAEREYAHTTVAQALDEYRDNFLQDVRPLLEEEQYVLLSNYETTEFNRERERLQIAINSR